MKRLTLTVAFFALFALPAMAQNDGHQHEKHPPQDMMQMMHRMMENPEHRAMMLPCLASELTDELDLSTVQQQRLAALQTESMNRMQEMNREGMREMDRQNMQEMMTERSTHVREILKREQLERLDNLDMSELHSAMMARMQSQEGGMMNCPMMKGMTEDAADQSHDHQH